MVRGMPLHESDQRVHDVHGFGENEDGHEQRHSTGRRRSPMPAEDAWMRPSVEKRSLMVWSGWRETSGVCKACCGARLARAAATRLKRCPFDERYVAVSTGRHEAEKA